MALEIRSITDEEFPAYSRAIAFGFGGHATDDELERWRPMTEMERTVAVFDRGRIVATAGAITFDLTLPGLDLTQVAGVTAVTVHPTHRRSGVLTKMMRHQLEDVHDRGEVIASLYASESIIYGRFGYGRATESTNIEIEKPFSAFREPVVDDGRLVIVDKDEARKSFPDVHDRVRRSTPGDVDRKPAWWDNFFLELDHNDKPDPAFYVVHETRGGEVDGYASYRMKGNWEQGLPNGTLQVREMISADATARARLWRYLLDVDLIRKVEARGRPADEPLRWLLADPRRMRTTIHVDQTWLRLVDVPNALAARRYTGSGKIVFEVADPFLGWNEGRYSLEVDDGLPRVKRVRTSPDITIEARDLGATYLGGVRFTSLLRAGRIEERKPGAARRVDLLFESDPPPYCTTDF